MTIDTNHPQRNPLAELVSLDVHEKSSRGLMYTPQEIWQQPATWRNTFLRVSERAEQLRGFLAKSLSESATVYLIGAGTSDYVGRALTSVLRESWHCNVIAVPSTELITEIGSYVLPGKPYLFISFSRSGDSSEGVGVLEQALREYPQVRHLVVACNQNGKMPELCAGRENAFALVLDDAVNDRGLAMTSSFTNMVVAGQCIANLSNLAEYELTLNALIHMGSRMLSEAAPIAESISKMQCRKAVFVGTGSLAAVATECALKSLELTAGALYTMSESVMGLRHGPMSAMDGETLFVALLSSDKRRLRYEIDLLEEVHAKGLGRVRVAIAPVANEGLRELCDHTIVLDAPAGFPDDYLAPVDVIFGQVFGLFASISAGLHPDQPSPDGTISRVVSHVKLY